nr:hypothetical protein [Angiostrongylus cantonensis]
MFPFGGGRTPPFGGGGSPALGSGGFPPFGGFSPYGGFQPFGGFGSGGLGALGNRYGTPGTLDSALRGAAYGALQAIGSG